MDAYEGEDPGRGYQLASVDLSLARDPVQVLDDARRAAQALKSVIDSKPKPVRFNNETYLEFEDWQTVGRFYGITAKVVHTAPVEFDGVRGFEARAVAIHAATGVEVSAADSMCLSDERTWNTRPLVQLRSMAQTRACSKALRNVLAWVVVLAGYRPTPAEEMGDDAGSRPAAGHASQPLVCSTPGCGMKLTQGQANFSEKQFGRYLCPTCQKSAAKDADVPPTEDAPHPARQGQRERREETKAAAPLAHASADAQRTHDVTADVFYCERCGRVPIADEYVAQCRATNRTPILCEACEYALTQEQEEAQGAFS